MEEWMEGNPGKPQEKPISSHPRPSETNVFSSFTDLFQEKEKMLPMDSLIGN